MGSSPSPGSTRCSPDAVRSMRLSQLPRADQRDGQGLRRQGTRRRTHILLQRTAITTATIGRYVLPWAIGSTLPSSQMVLSPRRSCAIRSASRFKSSA